VAVVHHPAGHQYAVQHADALQPQYVYYLKCLVPKRVCGGSHHPKCLAGCCIGGPLKLLSGDVCRNRLIIADMLSL
jgi:hypothetical protein